MQFSETLLLAYIQFDSSGSIYQSNYDASLIFEEESLIDKNIYFYLPILKDYIQNLHYQGEVGTIILKTKKEFNLQGIIKSSNNCFDIFFLPTNNLNELSISNYLYHFLDFTRDFVYLKRIVNKKHIFVATSTSMAKLCGFDSWQEMIGLDDFDVFPTEFAQKYYETEREIVESGHGKQFRQSYLNTDGSIGWVSTIKNLIKDENGKVIGIFGISRDITPLKKAEDELVKVATKDTLTGVNNRWAFNQNIDDLIKISNRYNRTFSIAHFDIDDFKGINDTYGHQVGDKTLINFAKIINSYIRDSDSLFRIGGDEFILLLPETKLPGAKVLIERLLDEIKDAKFDTITSLSCSIGMTIYAKGDNWADIYNRCDKALYQSKKMGKSCLSIVEKEEK